MSDALNVERWYRLLQQGDATGAWDEFVTRYRRVIFAAIRFYTTEADEVMDVFAHVCEQLRDRELRRLRSYRPAAGALVSTWLVAVVRNLTVDWFRRSNGRRSIEAGLANIPEIQREIFGLLARQGMTYREAYETLAQTRRITFGAFLREVRGLHTAVAGRERLFHELIGRDPLADLASDAIEQPPDPAVLREVQDALESLPPQARAAVQLFVVEGLTAAEVSEALGWGNPKKVYNTVYRTLEQLKELLHAGEKDA